MQTTKNHSIYFLLACIFALAYLVYLVAKPFLGPLILAAVFAFLFHPVYEKILFFTKNRKNISAIFTTIIAILVIILPIYFLITQIVNESTFVYKYIAEGRADYLLN
jgi:predicted PurR-regulated permease PerM